MSTSALAQRTQEKLMERIKALRKLKENRKCFECLSKSPSCVDTTHNTFVCMTCGGILRMFNFRVKSISISSFAANEVEALENGGNKAAKKKWLGGFSGEFPVSGNTEQIKEFVRKKYEEGAWTNKTSSKTKRKSSLKNESYKEEPEEESETEAPVVVERRKSTKGNRKAANAPPTVAAPPDLLDLNAIFASQASVSQPAATFEVSSMQQPQFAASSLGWDFGADAGVPSKHNAPPTFNMTQQQQQQTGFQTDQQFWNRQSSSSADFDPRLNPQRNPAAMQAYSTPISAAPVPQNLDPFADLLRSGVSSKNDGNMGFPSSSFGIPPTAGPSTFDANPFCSVAQLPTPNSGSVPLAQSSFVMDPNSGQARRPSLPQSVQMRQPFHQLTPQPVDYHQSNGFPVSPPSAFQPQFGQVPNGSYPQVQSFSSIPPTPSQQNYFDTPQAYNAPFPIVQPTMTSPNPYAQPTSAVYQNTMPDFFRKHDMVEANMNDMSNPFM